MLFDALDAGRIRSAFSSYYDVVLSIFVFYFLSKSIRKHYFVLLVIGRAMR